MALRLTPEMLRAAYDYINTTEPFSKWNLPEGDDVTFKVIKTRRLYGDCQRIGDGKYRIRISAAVVGTTHALMTTMAHEMIHVHEEHSGMARAGVQHGKAFRKLAEEVCKIHELDLKLF